MKKFIGLLVIVFLMSSAVGYYYFSMYQPPAIRVLSKYIMAKIVAIDYALKKAVIQLDANTSANVVYTDDNKPLIGETWKFQVHQLTWDKTTIHFIQKVN